MRVVSLAPAHVQGLPRALRDAARRSRGNAYTALYREVPVACGGVAVLWPGVAEAWLLLLPAFDKSSFAMIRALRRGVVCALRELEQRLGLHRIQGVVPADFSAGRTWARHLGFVEEGVMRRYGADRMDYVRIARYVR